MPRAQPSPKPARPAAQKLDSPNAGPSPSFDYHCRTRIVFGEGTLERVGELARELGAKKILLVTDAGIVAVGHAKKTEALLLAAGLKVTLFSQVRENPTTRDVDACLTVARQAGVDAMIGLGGGSSMDTAKGCNFLLTNGGKMQDYWGTGKAAKPLLPMIAIPTTAGTGSECQSFALIADEITHQKMACGDAKAAARVAILDPTLTLSQPERVTACTGIDALTHALETAVTRKRNAISQVYAGEAFRLTVGNLGKVLKQPRNIQARGQMLLGAAFAGIAIENSMLGAAHALANPLTAHFNIPHGQAVGMMLPWVVGYNAKDKPSRKIYANLAMSAGLTKPSDNESAAIAALLWHLKNLLKLAKFPLALSACGIIKESLPGLAEEAAGQWTAAFNPRTVTKADLGRLYADAW